MEATDGVEHTSTYQQQQAGFQPKDHAEEQPATIEDQWHDIQQDQDHHWGDEIDSAIDPTESIACVTSLPYSTQPLTA
jgi:hypothetical protein